MQALNPYSKHTYQSWLDLSAAGKPVRPGWLNSNLACTKRMANTTLPIHACSTTMLHRLLDVINSMECLNGEPWRPAVLPPGTPTAQHSVLQAFREGTCNLLIAQAGVPCSLDGILCDTIIRLAAAL